MNFAADKPARSTPLAEKPEATNAFNELWQSADANIARPLFNAAFFEPIEALEKTGRQIVRCENGETKVQQLKVPEADFLSGQWFCQSVAGGLGSIVPYSIAQKIAAANLRLIGNGRTSGIAASVFKSNSLAQILGATALDALKAPREGDTRWGNAAGSLLAFSIYELSNCAFSKARLAVKIPALIATGSGAALAQYGVSGLLSGKDINNVEAVTKTAISGGIMNVALPGAQEGLSRAVGWSTKKLGFGIPVERHLGQLPREVKGTPLSEKLNAHIFDTPWLRVQDGSSKNSCKHELQLITTETTLRRTDNVDKVKLHAEEFLHEAHHYKDNKSTLAQSGFNRAAELLREGKNEEAFDIYRGVRLDQEIRACLAEDVVHESGKPYRQPEQIELLKQSLPMTEVGNGLTYEHLWRLEFASFKDSDGLFFPQVDYMGRRKPEPCSSELINNWHQHAESKKREILSKFDTVPSGYRWNLWQRAIVDEALPVRIAAAENIHNLPSGQMVAAWRSIIHSNDYFPRLVALMHLKDLPQEARTKCWMQAMYQGQTFAVPRAMERRLLGFSFVSGGLRKPDIPDLQWWPGQDSNRLRVRPAEALVASIESLPGGDRAKAWNLAVGRNLTAWAAAENIAVVPKSQRLQAWQEAWNKPCPGFVRDGLTKQIAVLPESQRIVAWKELVDSHADIDGQAVGVALESLNRPSDQSVVMKCWSQIKNDKVAAKAIEYLPEKQRYRAWQRIASLEYDVPWDYLAPQIGHLAESDRFTALKIAIEKSSHADVSLAIVRMPSSDWARTVDLIFGVPDVRRRQDFHKRIETWLWSLDHGDHTACNREELVESMFVSAVKQADKHGTAVDYGKILDWWHQLPEQFDENLPDFLQKTPVKDHLLTVLDTKSLGRILFGGVNLQLSDRLTESYPGIIRDLANESWLTSDKKFGIQSGEMLEQFLANGSIAEAIQTGLKQIDGIEYGHGDVPAAVASIAKNAHGDVSKNTALALNELKQVVFSAGAALSGEAKLALYSAGKIAKNRPDLFKEHFLTPLELALGDPASDYSWKIDLARKLSEVQRMNNLESIQVELPSLRMPPPIRLSRSEQINCQRQIESELYSAPVLGKSLVSGTLAKLFPTVLGSEGGIVGRPQHGGHEFDLHVHTLHVVNKVRENPQFKTLSQKDQVNLLWAALLHDVGKAPGEKDVDHEWVSGNVSWGILQSLGYPPQRIQRIVDLVSRHGEMSYNPGTRASEKLADENYRYDLAKHYSYPHAAKQLSILNEADIRSIDGTSHLWTEEVANEINGVTKLINKTIKETYPATIPVLTNEVPNHFGLFDMKGDYALLVHKSDYLTNHFLNHLASIESPQFSISSSLITPTHRNLYGGGGDFLAIVAGPPEHISQADRDNLGTGTSVDWKGHVKLSREWLEGQSEQDFVKEVDDRISKLGIVNRTGKKFKSLSKLWMDICQFDTADELAASFGADSVAYRALKEIHKTLTTDAEGKPNWTNNEIKLNCPTVTGIGIVRNKRPVYFENFSTQHSLKDLLGAETKPDWLVVDGDKPKETLVVPESLWKTAMTKQLPLVVLDP